MNSIPKKHIGATSVLLVQLELLKFSIISSFTYFNSTLSFRAIKRDWTKTIKVRGSTKTTAIHKKLRKEDKKFDMVAVVLFDTIDGESLSLEKPEIYLLLREDFSSLKSFKKANLENYEINNTLQKLFPQ